MPTPAPGLHSACASAASAVKRSCVLERAILLLGFLPEFGGVRFPGGSQIGHEESPPYVRFGEA